MDEERHGTVHYYEDTAEEWRWTFYAANGEVLALASESYVDRSGCVDGFNAMCLLVGGNPALVKVVFDEDAE